MGHIFKPGGCGHGGVILWIVGPQRKKHEESGEHIASKGQQGQRHRACGRTREVALFIFLLLEGVCVLSVNPYLVSCAPLPTFL